MCCRVATSWGLRPAVPHSCPSLVLAAAAAVAAAPAPAAGELNISDKLAFPAGRVGPDFVVSLLNAAALLRPGAAYDITLTIISSAGTATSAASVRLRAPSPPVPGKCSAVAGTTLGLFEVACSGWSTSHPPLTYAFAVEVADSAGQDFGDGNGAPGQNLSWIAPQPAATLEVRAHH